MRYLVSVRSFVLTSQSAASFLSTLESEANPHAWLLSLQSTSREPTSRGLPESHTPGRVGHGRDVNELMMDSHGKSIHSEKPVASAYVKTSITTAMLRFQPPQRYIGDHTGLSCTHSGEPGLPSGCQQMNLVPQGFRSPDLIAGCIIACGWVHVRSPTTAARLPPTWRPASLVGYLGHCLQLVSCLRSRYEG